MNNELREKQLKSLAKSSHGIALKDWLGIEISKLENISLIPEENFEKHARGNKAAAGVLRKLFRFLDIASKQTTEREKNPYI